MFNINNFLGKGAILSLEVEKAMLAVDRRYFVEEDPYEDILQSIGYGVEISAPHIVNI